jgi:hypothetical protein
MTRPGADGSAGIDATLDGQGPVQGAGLALSGQLGGDGTLGGRVTVRGPDLSQLLPAPHVAFHAEGRVSVAAGLAAADDLTVEIGGSPARGAVAFRLSPAPRLDLALAVSRLDLDAWLPTVLNSGPAGLSLGIDLSAEAADLAGGILRRVRGAFDLSGDNVEVRELQAVLPGDAELRLAGKIDRPDGAHARFVGDASLSDPSLRTTLAWLEQSGLGTLNSWPDGVLRTADLTGRASVDSSGIAITGLAGKVDGQDVMGSLSAKRGAGLALTAALRMDRLDLDPWLPTRVPSPAALSDRLRLYDIALRLDAGQALIGGMSIAPLSLDAAIEAGRVTVRKLDLGVNGARIGVSGTLIEGGRIADGRMDVQAPSAAPLADLLPDSLAAVTRRAAALLRVPITARMSASGGSDALALAVLADLGDLHVEARPTIDLGRRSWSGSIAVQHPGASRLAELLGLTGAPAWLGDGSLALLATVSSAPGRMSADTFDVTAGLLRASGQLALDASGPRPVLSGKIDADTVPLPLPYIRSPAPLPISALAGWDGSVALTSGKLLLEDVPGLERVAATLRLDNGVLRVDKFSARLGGGALSGSARLDTRAAPPTLAVDAAASGVAIAGPLFDTALDVTDGTLGFSLSLAAAGHAPATLLATLSGNIGATATDGTLRGYDLSGLRDPMSDDAVRAALAGGATPFESLRLAALIDHGELVVGDAGMSGRAGEARLTGTIDLPDSDANLRVALRPNIPDPPELGLRFSGALDSLERTPELTGLVKWRLDHGSLASAGTPPARPN